jgi:Xaa-Pro aminopeptidase
MDIGVRHHGYVSDISRTYALGEPTKRQRMVHAAVQSAQQEIIKLLKPGISIERHSSDADNILASALIELGLLRGRSDRNTIRKYFPHAIGHGLGVDAHDALGSSSVFLPGMVFTVEPGIYIPEEGIGVRIEDDVLITDSGRTNLSSRLSTDL